MISKPSLSPPGAGDREVRSCLERRTLESSVSAGDSLHIERSLPRRASNPARISPASATSGRRPGGISDAIIPIDKGPDPSL